MLVLLSLGLLWPAGVFISFVEASFSSSAPTAVRNVPSATKSPANYIVFLGHPPYANAQFKICGTTPNGKEEDAAAVGGCERLSLRKYRHFCLLRPVGAWCPGFRCSNTGCYTQPIVLRNKKLWYTSIMLSTVKISQLILHLLGFLQLCSLSKIHCRHCCEVSYLRLQPPL